MVTLQVSDIKGTKVGEVEIGDSIAGFKPNKQVIRDFAVMCLANRRSRTASTKTRAEVAGSGRKPWRQKGTGRARAGSLTSPIFRGGGVVFGPKPRDVYHDLPKKVRRLALKSILVQRLKENKVFIVDEFKLEKPETKAVAGILKNIKAEGKTLIIVKEPERNLILSARNLAGVNLRRTDNVNAFDILSCANLVITKESFDYLLGMIGNEGTA